MNLSIKNPLLSVLLLAGLCACNKTTTASYDVIPLPVTVDEQSGNAFTLDSHTSIIGEGEEMERNANLLAQYINASTGLNVSVNSNSGKPIKLCTTLTDENEEAYTLTVYADSVVINGASPRGLFYGIQTLRKSIPAQEASSVTLPAVKIYDKPRFGYRGAHFDVSRHFYTIDEVKTFIDMMALHNLNTFHWHLSDDQGWRIEIKKYPKLTTVGSVRKETVIGREPGEWDGKPVSGFYTQDEAREIVKYAAERYINVIPEIDMPGHMTAALASYPHLGCTGGPYDVWTQWGVTPEVLCPGNDSTMLFIKDVLNEIMDIFPSEYIHIGGDECPKIRWKECPKCQARIKREGIKAKGKFSAEDRLQGYVTRYAYNVIKERGRVMIGWDEILECDIPSDAIVTSWRGDAGAVDGAQRGNKVILSPNSHLYFDFYQTKDTQLEPFAIGGYLPVEKVYSFEPIPSELKGDTAKLVIGAQANLWTEYIKTFDHVQYMELPRMAALAEVVWSQPEKKDYASFLNRIPALLQIYDALGYNYAKHLADVSAEYTPNVDDKSLDVKLSTLKGRTIHYTLDGTEPTVKSPVCENSVKVNSDAILKAASFDAAGTMSRIICDTISVNKASFCKATLNTQPHKNYTYRGVQTLFDGIKGNGNYRTGRWLGFTENDCDVTIDLGEVMPVSEVSVNCCIFQCDGVVDAAGMSVSTSKDGQEFELMGNEDYPEMDKALEFGITTHSIAAQKATEARYVNVVVKSVKSLPKWHGLAGSNGFVFVDEISVK